MARRRQRVRVTGQSMTPTLADGEFVLVDRSRAPRPGDVVMARHPYETDLLVIKRLDAIDPDGMVVVASDNPTAGSDSRSWGPLEPSLVLGVVTLILDRATTGSLDRPNR